MKNLSDLLLLGDPRLYEICDPVTEDDLHLVEDWIEDLHNVMQQIKAKYNFGRGIAAPQLGIMKRLVYINIDRPIVIINPNFKYKSEELFELWDDCMSFPHLLVKVDRHKKVEIEYRDRQWNLKTLKAEGGMSELIQHELDHLDGVLCINRAKDARSLKYRIFD